MEMLRAMALKQDRALVIVTHDARIFGFADRIAKMDDGRVVRVISDHDKIHDMAENGLKEHEKES
jgi:putative ABC transport system ATP-binding protein